MSDNKIIDSQPNPLLDKLRIPGATFRLPSQGLFYQDGELDPNVRNGEVEVYPMTAMDEIIISTPDKLLSGKAITEVFTRCIPSILKPELLLSKDVDFLMCCLRLVTFGEALNVTYTHNCEGAKQHEYAVKLSPVIRAAKQIDPTSINTAYTITMVNGQKVILNPLRYDAVVQLYEMTAMMKNEDISEEEARMLVVGTLANVIKSVDGETDKKRIEEWAYNIPLGWKKEIQTVAQNVNSWGVDLKETKKCLDCGEDIVLEVAANPVSFFT